MTVHQHAHHLRHAAHHGELVRVALRLVAVVIEAVARPELCAHRRRDTRADDLSGDLMKALLEKVQLPGSTVEDIHWGCVKQQGEQGYNIGRMAALIAGLPVEVAADTVNRLCGSSLQAINQAADNITGGKTLAAPLAACKYFPRDIGEMVAVGEESNSLETVLINIADALEKRTGRQLELFVKLLEPVMLLVMACIVLLVVMGLLLPIFKMGSTVQ